MTKLKALIRMPTPRFIGYLVTIGGLAGLLAWCVVLAGSLVFGFNQPALSSLLLAILRGSVLALIVGFGLRLWWLLRDR